MCFLLYSSQNNLKKRCQDWLCVYEKPCAIVKYLPYQDTLLRTTLEKWLINFDIYEQKLQI